MLVDLELVSDAAAQAARRRLEVTTGAPWSARAYDLVVESLPEDLRLKAQVLAPVVEALPQAVVASNTSSLSITELGTALGAGERTVGTHYWNPPLLMPPVEVVMGTETRRDVVEFVVDLLRELGKEPMVVERDVPGFVWNRLLHALLRESLWLVHNGVASPETVDGIVRSGLARRARLTGVFGTVALGGADTWRQVAEEHFPRALERGRARRSRPLRHAGSLKSGCVTRLAGSSARQTDSSGTHVRIQHTGRHGVNGGQIGDL